MIDTAVYVSQDSAKAEIGERVNVYEYWRYGGLLRKDTIRKQCVPTWDQYNNDRLSEIWKYVGHGNIQEELGMLKTSRNYKEYSVKVRWSRIHYSPENKFTLKFRLNCILKNWYVWMKIFVIYPIRNIWYSIRKGSLK